MISEMCLLNLVALEILNSEHVYFIPLTCFEIPISIVCQHVDESDWLGQGRGINAVLISFQVNI